MIYYPFSLYKFNDSSYGKKKNNIGPLNKKRMS